MRSLVFPDAPEPEYTGQIVWRYNVPRPEGLETLDMFVGANGKAGFVPLAPDLMYVLYIEAVPPEEVKMPDDRLAEIFRERLAEFGGPVAEVRDTLHHRPGEGRRPPGRVAARAAAVAPRPGRADRRRGACDLAACRPGRRDGDRGRDRARRRGHAEAAERALDRYVERRYPRCREIWEISRQIGTWEIEHTPPPEADFVGLTMKSVHVTAAPV